MVMTMEINSVITIKIQFYSIIKKNDHNLHSETKPVLITLCDYEGVVHQKCALQLWSVNRHLYLQVLK
jgi:hypothetical protein